MNRRFFYGITGILLSFGLLSLYRLDEIPGEWYGDITALNSQVTQILQGKPDLGYICGSGPVYPLFASVFARLYGINYLTYKIATVSAGALGILLTYFFIYRLLGHAIALMTGFFMATSFWYLAWARLGSTPVMMTPVLSVTMFLMLFLFRKDKRILWLVTGSVVSMLGLFTYPGAYLYPVSFVLVYLFTGGRHHKFRTFRELAIIAVSMLPLALLFYHVVITQPATFLDSQGYIGAKILPILTGDPGLLIGKTITNVIKTWGSYLYRGDVIFRQNVPESPHLDVISGVLFYLGLILTIFVKPYRKFIPYLLVPLIIFPIPSMMPVLPDGEIPSMTRTYGTTPFVFTVVAIGLHGLYDRIRRISGVYMGKAAVIILFMAVTYLNVNKYFVIYPKTLPNHNIAYGKIIASYVDSFPPEIPVYMTGCCWGDWGQPEVHGVYYNLRYRQGRQNIILDQYDLRCEDVNDESGALLIMNPNEPEKIMRFAGCFPEAVRNQKTDPYGNPIYVSLYIPKPI